MTQNAISTKGLAVNAAFLKDIKDDNRHLKELVDRIDPFVSRTEIAANHWPELIRCFASLRDQLALHFSLEEAYGYFDEAIDACPELSIQAESLRNEHTKLFESIRIIADAAGEVSGEQNEKLEKLLVRYQTFLTMFQKHEELELKLILEAMDDDIGVCD